MTRIEVLKGDITKLEVDAIVNAANTSLLGGGGVDGAIHRAAGPELLEECRTLNGCQTGQSKITKGYNLPAKFVIHTVGPVWHGGNKSERALLKSCYTTALNLAKENGIKTIAFPAISCGVYHFPLEEACNIATDTVREFIIKNDCLEKVIFIDINDAIIAIYKRIEIEKIWKISKEILLDSLKDKPYKKYLEPQPIENSSINSIVYRMLFHAQNNRKKKNAIKFEEYKEQYKKVLKQFNPKELSKMTENDIKQLLEKNIKFYPKGQFGKDYARVIKEVSKFLSPFDDANDFINFCEFINSKVDKKYLPKMIQDIHWYGNALSRDFLKELGFDCYAKPDVHVKDFISNVFNCKNEDLDVLEKINEISEISKEKIYFIDKLIYLSCTHDFYLKCDEKYRDNKSPLQNNNRRQLLINKIKKYTY